MSYSSDNPIARVFFALWPSVEESGALAAWQVLLKDLCGGRAVRAETLHATLVFIGEIKQARLEALQLAAQEVVAESFELRFEKARYWGTTISCTLHPATCRDTWRNWSVYWRRASPHIASGLTGANISRMSRCCVTRAGPMSRCPRCSPCAGGSGISRWCNRCMRTEWRITAC